MAILSYYCILLNQNLKFLQTFFPIFCFLNCWIVEERKNYSISDNQWNYKFDFRICTIKMCAVYAKIWKLHTVILNRTLARVWICFIEVQIIRTNFNFSRMPKLDFLVVSLLFFFSCLCGSAVYIKGDITNFGRNTNW